MAQITGLDGLFHTYIYIKSAFTWTTNQWAVLHPWLSVFFRICHQYFVRLLQLAVVIYGVLPSFIYAAYFTKCPSTIKKRYSSFIIEQPYSVSPPFPSKKMAQITGLDGLFHTYILNRHSPGLLVNERYFTHDWVSFPAYAINISSGYYN